MQLEEGGQEMTFTNDDLNCLRKEFSDWNFPRVDNDVMDALLARLEAAEDVCRKYALLTVVCNHKPQNWDIVDAAYKAWREAAGR